MNIVNYKLFENKEKLNSPFTMNEVKVIIKELKNGKAYGYNVLNEFLKLSTQRILKLLLDFFNLALRRNLITSKWCLDIITPIHKEGLKSNPDNYRGICVMNS